MKTGVSVSDKDGVTWTVGQELGRDACARRFVARDASGKEAMLTVSNGPDAFTGDQAEAHAATCAEVVRERAAWMRERTRSWLPELLGTATLDDGREVLFTPRYPATLAHRVRAGAPLAGLLDALIAACEAIAAGPHGELRAEHVLLHEDGSVRLVAPVTPTWQAQAATLLAASSTSAPVRVLPPEIATPTPSAMADTYALCLALYRAATIGPAGPDGRRAEPPSLPDGGLDKVALSAVKDRVHARLQQERANPRFASRVADKLGAVLNRGLSRQPAPSPPYRFGSPTELAGRLREVRDLVDPTVVNVGKVLLSTDARDGMFEGGTDAAFSTTVTVTPGASHEDLATGLLVRDLDAEGDDRVPVPDARYGVKPHPSGRLRFDFELPELRPGRYTVRIAFTIKDSGHEPSTTDGHFEIRPPPGYVPPADEPPPEASALRFPASGKPGEGGEDERPPAVLHAPRMDDDGISDLFDDDDSDYEGDFPSPIAPSDPGSSPAADAPPPPRLQAVPTPPPSDASVPSSSGSSPGTGHRDDRPASPRLGIAPSTTGDDRVPSIAPRPSGPPSAGVNTMPPGFDPGPDDVDVTREAPAGARDTGDAPRAPSWGAPGGSWESELPGLDEPAPAAVPHTEPTDGGGLLPSPEGMEDLPGLDEPAPDPFSALIASATAFLRDNAWVALVIVVGALVTLLALAGLLFQALAG